MYAFLFVVVIACLIFYFFTRNKQIINPYFDDDHEKVGTWISSRNGDATTQKYAVYDDQKLPENSGARIWVGEFNREGMEPAGFLIEILDGEVVLGELFDSVLVGSHREFSRRALQRGITLYALLKSQEAMINERFKIK